MSQPTTAPAPHSFRSVLRVVAASIIAAAFLIASVGIPQVVNPSPTIAERALICLGLCLGPLTGWILVLGRGWPGDALPMVALSTVVCLVPLVRARVSRSPRALVLSAFIWLASGYLCSIAIWA